jgi:phosphosulfolactate phosphohydrolase-like enzyme
MGNPNLEDMYGAGYFVDLLTEELGEGRDFSDAAWAARALYRSERAESLLLRSRVGQMMQERGLTEEVKFAARLSVMDVVPKLVDGRLMPVAPRNEPRPGFRRGLTHSPSPAAGRGLASAAASGLGK